MTKKIIAVLVAIAAVTALVASPAQAHATAEATSALFLAVQSHDRTDTATLTCQPPGGTHPRAAASCRAITQAGGDLTQLSGLPDQVCTDQYEPVTAMAVGSWKGRPIFYLRTFGNDCEMDRATFPVFALTRGV